MKFDDDSVKSVLNSIGFSKNESEVYISLLGSGMSTVLKLAKRTSIHRSNLYDVLRILMNKGFIYEVEGPPKQFSARALSCISEYLKQKEFEINEISKEYDTDVNKTTIENKIKVSKGLFAIREALFDLIKMKKTIDVMGAPSQAPELIGPILKEVHKARMKNKITMRHIYNSDSEERVKFLNKMPYTKAKILPPNYDAKVTTHICGNKVQLVFWEKEIMVIEITDENLASVYSNYFELLWKIKM